MKKILSISLALFFIAGMLATFAQGEQRVKVIPKEKAQAIQNAIQYRPTDSPAPAGGGLLFSENFDNTGGALPAGWSVTGNSTACVWAVDATPDPSGFYSAPYSLNFNNGLDFDCGDVYGAAYSPMIDVSGMPFTVSLRYAHENECSFYGYPPGYDCGWDGLFVITWDENDNFIGSYYLLETQGNWDFISLPFQNPDQAGNIYIEFYFATYDGVLNAYTGPFIDNIEVYEGTGNVIPVSNWALVIGLMLIVAFTVIRFRRTI